MTIARSQKVFIGTDESTGDSISNNATDTGSEVDVLGDDTSTGEIEMYLKFTSTVTAGTVDVTVNGRRVTTQAYKKLAADFQVAPVNGTRQLPLGTFRAARFMQVDVLNNATGASATNVFIGGTLTKFS